MIKDELGEILALSPDGKGGNSKKTEKKDKKYCIVLVDVDNFDELLEDSDEETGNAVISGISKIVRNWGTKMEASVTRYTTRHFIMFVEERFIHREEEKKFKILEDIKKLDTKTDFPVTLSIGVGMGGKSPSENDKYAIQGVDMAKGRGGDQVVVNTGSELKYYGGKTPSVEKLNKGKSRIMGYALRALIDRASKVFIMGHKNPDMDSFGAALGMYRFTKTRYKPVYIVCDEVPDALEVMYQQLVGAGEHNIIKSDKALELLDKHSVVVMVDTNRPSISTSQELFNKAVRTVVIDHHRKSGEESKPPTFSYMEAYASSSAELVTEILQYTIDRKQLKSIEANVLLGGIMLDTNFFSVKAGVRTFEAAAWLKRAGADITQIKKFFQIKPETFKLKAECYKNAEMGEDGIAYAVYNGRSADARVMGAQVADDFLAVRGMRASFVASIDNLGKTYISARSLEEINVQLVMEELGGGGRLNTAGAQVDMAPEEAIERIKKILKDGEYL